MLLKFDKNEASKYVLDSKTDIQLIQFIRDNLDKELIVWNLNEYTHTVTVKSWDKTKSYELPVILFQNEPEEESSEEENNQKKEGLQPSNDTETNNTSKQDYIKPIQEVFFKHRKDIIKISLSLITWFILTNYFINSNASDLTSDNILRINQNQNQLENEIKPKNDFELLTEKSNKNRDIISKKLQYQKDLREKREELNKLIEASKNEVSNLESENLQIRNNLLQLSQ